MKRGQFSAVKSAVEVVNNRAQKKMAVQRVVEKDGKQYIQIITSLAVLTILADKPVAATSVLESLGSTDNWKLAKGLITVEEPLAVAAATQEAMCRIADSELWMAHKLLQGTDALADVSFILKNGLKLAMAPDKDTVLWSWNKAGGLAAKELETQWTKNVESISGKYAVIPEWIKHIATGALKDRVDGVSYGCIGAYTGVHLVSKQLGIVVGCTGSFFPKDTEVTVQYKGQDRKFCCDPTQMLEEDVEMKAVVDPSVLMGGETSIVNQVPEEVEKPNTVVVTYPEKTESTPSTYQGAPIIQPVNRDKPATPITDDPAAKETTSEPELQQETADSVLEAAVASLEEITEKAKAVLKAVKQARKLHKAELKDASSGKQQNERIAELEAKLKKIQNVFGL